MKRICGLAALVLAATLFGCSLKKTPQDFLSPPLPTGFKVAGEDVTQVSGYKIWRIRIKVEAKAGEFSAYMQALGFVGCAPFEADLGVDPESPSFWKSLSTADAEALFFVSPSQIEATGRYRRRSSGAVWSNGEGLIYMLMEKKNGS